MLPAPSRREREPLADASMVTTAGLSCSAMSANAAEPGGTTALSEGVAVTRPVVGADWAGEGVRLPANTRPIIAPTAMARPMVMAANRRVIWDIVTGLFSLA
jgi:hypothetical protein